MPRTTALALALCVLLACEGGTPAAPPPVANNPTTGTCNGVVPPNRCDVGSGSPPPTARCKDGLWSCSQTRSGTCSGHGGVDCYVCPGPLC